MHSETQIIISITTDNYPLETSWQLIDQTGAGHTNLNPLTQSSTTYTWNICVPDTNCYQFTVYDTYGDGLCCCVGKGWASLKGIVTRSGPVNDPGIIIKL